MHAGHPASAEDKDALIREVVAMLRRKGITGASNRTGLTLVERLEESVGISPGPGPTMGGPR